MVILPTAYFYAATALNKSVCNNNMVKSKNKNNKNKIKVRKEIEDAKENNDKDEIG